jgi:lipid-A-disaccharide synthase
MNSCFILAGEKSGEEHALTFFPQLINSCPTTHFFGVGGDELKNAGVELLYHFKDFSSMGFSEVISKVPFYFKALKTLENEILKRGTKVAILIDFQDFNLRLAKNLKKRGVKVLYYVAPQAWAWKEWRAKEISTSTHTLFTILPFEKKWFKDRGVEQVVSIPHPLILRFGEDLKQIAPKNFKSWTPKIKILILPGSRSFEVRELLPIFTSALKLLKKEFKIEAHLVKVEHLESKLYDTFISEYDYVYESHEINQVMKECHFALAASGTVTLATALFELPTVVCYRASLLNEFIFNNFIKYKGPISLTNIISEQNIFPELTQEEVTPTKICRLLKNWLECELQYNKTKVALKKLKSLLKGDEISVPEYIARVINE